VKRHGHRNLNTLCTGSLQRPLRPKVFRVHERHSKLPKDIQRLTLTVFVAYVIYREAEEGSLVTEAVSFDSLSWCKLPPVQLEYSLSTAWVQLEYGIYGSDQEGTAISTDQTDHMWQITDCRDLRGPKRQARRRYFELACTELSREPQVTKLHTHIEFQNSWIVTAQKSFKLHKQRVFRISPVSSCLDIVELITCTCAPNRRRQSWSILKSGLVGISRNEFFGPFWTPKLHCFHVKPHSLGLGALATGDPGLLLQDKT